jgi:hypothetical protein
MSAKPAVPEQEVIVSTFWQKADDAAAQNRAEEARAWLEGIVAIDETNVEAWLQLADLIPDPRERMQCYARVLELSPGHPQAKAGLRQARRAR